MNPETSSACEMLAAVTAGVPDQATLLPEAMATDLVVASLERIQTDLREYSAAVLDLTDELNGIGDLRDVMEAGGLTAPNAHSLAVKLARRAYFAVWSAVDILGYGAALTDSAVRLDVSLVRDQWDVTREALAALTPFDVAPVVARIQREAAAVRASRQKDGNGPKKRGRQSTAERDKCWYEEYSADLEAGKVTDKTEFAQRKGVERSAMSKALERGKKEGANARDKARRA